MKHVQALNRKARMTEQKIVDGDDVIAMQEQQPLPLSCTTVFDPGWEIDALGGMGLLCQPMERDLYACYNECWWPAQLPDQMVNYPDWSEKCASAVKDWRRLDLIFP